MKVLIVKKKSLIAGILAVCFAILFIVAMANFIPTAVQAVGQAKKIPIYCVDKSEKVVSLSFDAAWGNAILGMEGRSQVRTNFRQTCAINPHQNPQAQAFDADSRYF